MTRNVRETNDSFHFSEPSLCAVVTMLAALESLASHSRNAGEVKGVKAGSVSDHNSHCLIRDHRASIGLWWYLASSPRALAWSTSRARNREESHHNVIQR
jgi:hypothetical protein